MREKNVLHFWYGTPSGGGEREIQSAQIWLEIVKIFAAEEFQHASGLGSPTKEPSSLSNKWREWVPTEKLKSLRLKKSSYCSNSPRDLAEYVQLSEVLLILFVAPPVMYVSVRVCTGKWQDVHNVGHFTAHALL